MIDEELAGALYVVFLVDVLRYRDTQAIHALLEFLERLEMEAPMLG